MALKTGTFHGEQIEVKWKSGIYTPSKPDKQYMYVTVAILDLKALWDCVALYLLNSWVVLYRQTDKQQT